jgi:hypothetical protein
MECERAQEHLLDLLYDEADPASRRRAEEHLSECAACRGELAGLRGVRRDLRAWRLPRPRLRGAWDRLRAPAVSVSWLAAAAVMVIALGAALGLSGAGFRFEAGPMTISLGRPARELAARVGDQERQIGALRAALADQDGRNALLREVGALIEQSEARQAQRMNAAWLDYSARAETQRRYDLARVSAGLSYLDRRTGEHAARTSELVSYLLDASAPQ